ncbi:MAG: MOSC domain-containing protein [Acidobacteria bacterium]|nr:MOSC domain-containing protein [Acidobacteriota bacterium]
MKLLAVSVSMGKEVPYMDKTVTTGIFNEPVSGRVMLRTLNLDGDRQIDLRGHGGPYKAVYVYTMENYEHWKRELGRTDFQIPQFGENFTVEGMTEDKIHVGDVFRVGDALVEVTQPRVPCYRLGIKMGDPKFPKRFLQSCLVGFYLRVLEEGAVGAGDNIEMVRQDPEAMSVRKVCHLYYFDPKNLEECKRAIRIAALSPGWREGFLERLQKAGITVERSEAPKVAPKEATKDEMCCGPKGQEVLSN